VRHGEIQDDEVGLKGAGLFHGFHTVDGLAANFKSRIVLQESANGIPYGGFVFDDEDAFGHWARENIAQRFLKESRVNPVYENRLEPPGSSPRQGAQRWFIVGQYEIESLRKR
jgi:hypothetical protein